MESWGVSRFKVTDKQKYVTNIHLCGYINEKNEGDENGRPPTNHWSAFLQYSEKGSVQIDMVPGGGSDGTTGMLIIESKKCVYTDKAVKKITLPTMESPLVQDIIELILKNKRDKYKFTDDFEGCRYWIQTFVSDLEEAAIIAVGSKILVADGLSKYWRWPSGSEARPIERGTFI